MSWLCGFSAIELFVFIKTLQAACVKFLIYALLTEIFIYISLDTNLHPCCILTDWFIVVFWGLLIKELGGIFSGLSQFYFWMQQNLSGSTPLMFSLSTLMDHVNLWTVHSGWQCDRLACRLGTTYTSAQTQLLV